MTHDPPTSTLPATAPPALMPECHAYHTFTPPHAHRGDSHPYATTGQLARTNKNDYHQGENNTSNNPFYLYHRYYRQTIPLTRRVISSYSTAPFGGKKFPTPKLPVLNKESPRPPAPRPASPSHQRNPTGTHRTGAPRYPSGKQPTHYCSATKQH